MRIALTGATGLLGRNLLFEIIKQNLSHLDDIEIIVLGRSHKTASINDRIKDIIINDGIHYIEISPQNKNLINKILERIIPIPFDLTKDDLGISEDDYKILKRGEIDIFFHLAALLNFSTDKATKARLEIVNINGTNQILRLTNNLSVKELVYSGTAYSCGDVSGVIGPDYINDKSTYRNYYEESKLLAELNVRKYSREHKMKHRIFRPAGIVGRLIEAPIGSMCKYDLFYEWAAFFLREKIKQLNTIKDIFDKELFFPTRIACDLKFGMNFIAADYAAKIMYAASVFDDPNVSYHLSSNEDIPHGIYLALILKELNISGIKLVETEPEDKNKNEKLYYKSVGKAFTPYLLFKNPKFDNSNLKDILKRINLSCPKINGDNFKKLLKYAKDHYFGLSDNYLKRLEAK